MTFDSFTIQRILLRASACALFFVAAFASAQTTNPIVIDANQPFQLPVAARYDLGSSRSPKGDVIGVNSRYLTLNGKPWLPVMGEFHFSRYPANRWEEEILKMKAAGVNIIATYVIWIHHEEIEGQFDWTGQRDLRAFAQLCAEHHMYMVARIGPWAHGETRNGGFPDWVVQQGGLRENDPAYLKSVTAWYGQIGRQLNGLLWKDGGPVIAIQLENEYARTGPGAGEAHILELKRIAVAAGFDVPFYFVTGWDNAVVPERAVLPVQGGYPDAPWDASLKPWPPAEVYAFRLQSRIAANLPADATPQQPVPFLTAELGAGIEDTYHRRPVIQPDDIASIVPVMLGSGVNLYGTYMFQGGENPDGKLTTLQESQATGYPTDVPVKSYDFQAPLSEFGEERASFRKLKVFQYFLNGFGTDLAPMTVSAPKLQPANPADLSVLRATVRSRNSHGFLFVNNYVRGASMPSHPSTQFQIRLPGESLQLPRTPLDIPSGASFIWPFNLPMGNINLRYSTAQLFSRIDAADITTFYFAAIPGIPIEFAIDAAHARLQHTSSGHVTRQNNTLYISDIAPGIDASIDLVPDAGPRIRLVPLRMNDAENAWKVTMSGTEGLLITSQDFFFDPDSSPSRIFLRTLTSPRFSFTLLPAPTATPTASLPLTRSSSPGPSTSFTASAAPVGWLLNHQTSNAPGIASPVKTGSPAPGKTTGVAEAPTDAAFQQAARWSITLQPNSMHGPSDLFLAIRYTGDVARLYRSGHLLTDNFYNGQPWFVGLSRFIDPSHPASLDLEILPLPADAPIYIESPYRPAQLSTGQAVDLQQLELLPEYQLVIDANPR